MKTIAQATMEAVLTEPNGVLVVNEIRKQVEDMLQIESKGSAIPNYFSVWAKKGILKRVEFGKYEFNLGGREKIEALKGKAEKKSWKKRPAGQPKNSKQQLPANIDSLQIGNAILDKIDSLRQEITDLKHKLTDAAIRHDADLKAWRQKFKGQESTIRELRTELERQKKANEVRRRTVPLSEVAIIK